MAAPSSSSSSSSSSAAAAASSMSMVDEDDDDDDVAFAMINTVLMLAAREDEEEELRQKKEKKESDDDDDDKNEKNAPLAVREALLKALHSALANIRSARPSFIDNYLLPRHYEDIVADDDLIDSVGESVERAERVLRCSGVQP